MTEVASSPAAGLQVLSVRHYEAPPPANLNTQLVDPENAYATTKEEEWVTKKKVELTTKRQIETRVKRQVVLEDGKVVEDSGPIVTTNTTEDTEKQESSQTEHRHLGDDEPDADGWVAVTGSGGVVKEVKERTVKSREEKEERLETEDIQHLGDISDEAYLSAIQRQSKEGGDLRVALEKTLGNELQRTGIHEGRIVHQSCKTKRVVDTDDKQHLSELQSDGRVVTQTRRTTEHEEVNNSEAPDEGKGSGEEEEDVHKSSSQHYTKTKDQEFVEYLANGKKIGEEMRYEAENVEGDRQGDPGLLPPVGDEWDSLSARVRKMRRSKLQGLGGATPLDRKDALTKKPLDFDQEEETRKVETSKWLEHHFGSESRSSKDSIGDEDELPATGTSTSFINVTMKSTKSRVNSEDLSKSLNGVNGNSSSRVFVSSPENGTSSPTSYFQGISEWKTSRESQLPERPVRTSLSSQGAFKDRVQVLPTGPNHTFTPPKSSPSPPYSSSNLGSKNLRGSQGSNLNLNGRNSSGPESSSPFQSITEKHMYNRYYRQEQASPSGERNSSPLYNRPGRASPYHAKIQHEKTSSEDEPARGHRRYNGHVEDNVTEMALQNEDFDSPSEDTADVLSVETPAHSEVRTTTPSPSERKKNSTPPASGNKAAKRSPGKMLPPSRHLKQMKTTSGSKKPQTRFEKSVDKLQDIAKIAVDNEDQFDKYGKYIASQLREMPLRSFIALQSQINHLITTERLHCLDADQEQSSMQCSQSPYSGSSRSTPQLSPYSQNSSDKTPRVIYDDDIGGLDILSQAMVGMCDAGNNHVNLSNF